MQYDENYDLWDAYTESLPVEGPEPDCECRLCGDQADASGCDLHGAFRIKTHYDYPPIPVRDYDWSAWVEGEEDEGMIVGRGPTKAAAIADLKTSIEEVA